MLTTEALENRERKDAKQDRFNDEEIFNDPRDELRNRALEIYRNELNKPYSTDLGLHGVTRAALRTLCKDAVLKSSNKVKRGTAQSTASTSIADQDQDKNAISALRMLQKERLIVSRLGFPDRAMQLDREIEVMRERAKVARAKEEEEMLDYRMKVLAMAQSRKFQRLESILNEETRQMDEKFKKEEESLLRRQEAEFLRVLENATRRAVGRVKKCNCLKEYTCRHNKTASYNTRRPTHTVVQYRRNAHRLKKAGRVEEAAEWSRKARELDEAEQEAWRARVAESIVSSSWGANVAAVDQITEEHKRELGVLRKSHSVKRDMHEKKQAMRRKNFQNTILAEQRKVRMQCRKQALLKIHTDYGKELREKQREESISYSSAGLMNVSKNLLGQQFDEAEKAAVDWVPPTGFGLENSVRLVDAVQTVGGLDQAAGGGRILTSFKDIQSMTVDQIRDKIHSNLQDDDSEQDSESDDGNDDGDDCDDGDEVYHMGTTSGSRLVDKMRIMKNKKESKVKPAGAEPSTQQQQQLQGQQQGQGGTTGSGSFPGFAPPAGIPGAGFGGFGAPSTGGFGRFGGFNASSAGGFGGFGSALSPGASSGTTAYGSWNPSTSGGWTATQPAHAHTPSSAPTPASASVAGPSALATGGEVGSAEAETGKAESRSDGPSGGGGDDGGITSAAPTFPSLQQSATSPVRPNVGVAIVPTATNLAFGTSWPSAENNPPINNPVANAGTDRSGGYVGGNFATTHGNTGFETSRSADPALGGSLNSSHNPPQQPVVPVAPMSPAPTTPSFRARVHMQPSNTTTPQVQQGQQVQQDQDQQDQHPRGEQPEKQESVGGMNSTFPFPTMISPAPFAEAAANTRGTNDVSVNATTVGTGGAAAAAGGGYGSYAYKQDADTGADADFEELVRDVELSDVGDDDPIDDVDGEYGGDGGIFMNLRGSIDEAEQAAFEKSRKAAMAAVDDTELLPIIIVGGDAEDGDGGDVGDNRGAAGPDSGYVAANNSGSGGGSSSRNSHPYPAIFNLSEQEIKSRPVDYVFNPEEDTKEPAFKPGSVRDEDWEAHDLEMAKGFGIENSFGISLMVVADEAPTCSSPSSSPNAHHTAQNGLVGTDSGGNGRNGGQAFGPGHVPPIAGSPAAVPPRSALRSVAAATDTTNAGSNTATASVIAKKLKFKGVEICRFEPMEAEPGTDGGGSTVLHAEGMASKKVKKKATSAGLFPSADAMVNQLMGKVQKGGGVAKQSGTNSNPANPTRMTSTTASTSGNPAEQGFGAPSTGAAPAGGAGFPQQKQQQGFGAPSTGAAPAGGAGFPQQQQQGFGAPSTGNAFFGGSQGQHSGTSLGDYCLPAGTMGGMGTTAGTESAADFASTVESSAPYSPRATPYQQQYAYGEGPTVDLSEERFDDGASSSTGDLSREAKGGPNWELCFFRFMYLDDVRQTLEMLLTDDEAFEAAELYVSTFESEHINDDGASPTPEHHHLEDRDHLTAKLQLMRAWLLYGQNAEDNEEILRMGLEDVFGLDQQETHGNLQKVLENQKEHMDLIYNDIAYDFVPEFILSSDFEAYFDTHQEIKSHNKKLRVDSKSWVGKFQKAVSKHSTPFHLFAFGGGRPYANKQMRSIFGPLCDSPSPREYLDPAATHPQLIQSVVDAMQTGTDLIAEVSFRAVRNYKPPGVLAIRHVRSHKNPYQIKYSLIMVLDLSTDGALLKRKVLEAMVKAIPAS